MLCRQQRVDQLPAKGTRGLKVLAVQVVLLFAGELRLDCHHFCSERIIIVSLVQLWRVLQVHLYDETFYLIEHLMIEYSEIEHDDAAVRKVQSLLHGAALVLAHPPEISVGHFLRHCPAVEVIRIYFHYV